jgi:hypothetical protein
MTANHGNVPQKEEWDRFPNRGGCARFFGLREIEDLENIRKVLLDADRILMAHDKLHVLEQLKWNLPGDTAYSDGDGPPDYYCLLKLIGREIGSGDPGDGILLEEAGLETAARYDPNFPLGPSYDERLEKVGLEMRVVVDFVSAFDEAMDKWSGPSEPYDLDSVVFQIQKAEAEPVPPVVESVTISKGQGSIQLTSSGRRQVPIIPRHYRLFSAFALRVLKDAPGEIVPWETLHALMGLKDAVPTASHRTLRRVLETLNDLLLAGLGQPPDGQDWILSKRKHGAYLNTSCAWRIRKALWKQLGGRPDVWTQSNADDVLAAESELPDDEKIENVRVERLFRSMRDGTYLQRQEGKRWFPDLRWEDIPHLLDLGDSWETLMSYSLNPNSSQAPRADFKEPTEGLVALWLIDCVRTGGNLPSLMPLLVDDKGKSDRPGSTQECAYDAYRRWWKSVRKMPVEDARKVEPFGGTGLRWY